MLNRAQAHLVPLFHFVKEESEKQVAKRLAQGCATGEAVLRCEDKASSPRSL